LIKHNNDIKNEKHESFAVISNNADVKEPQNRKDVSNEEASQLEIIIDRNILHMEAFSVDQDSQRNTPSVIKVSSFPKCKDY